jgi:hypothetical protein
MQLVFDDFLSGYNQWRPGTVENRFALREVISRA